MDKTLISVNNEIWKLSEFNFILELTEQQQQFYILHTSKIF